MWMQYSSVHAHTHFKSPFTLSDSKKACWGLYRDKIKDLIRRHILMFSLSINVSVYFFLGEGGG